MKHATFTILVVLTALAACSTKPSDDDVRAALLKQVEIIGGKAAAKSQQKELESLKVLGCKSSDAGGYVCSWNGPLGPGSGRFMSEGTGWVMVAAGG